MIGLGLPVAAEGRNYEYGFLAHCTQPKLFISGTQDPFGPKAMVAATVIAAAPPAEMVWVEGAEHFFVGKLDQVQTAIREWLERNFHLQQRHPGVQDK